MRRIRLSSPAKLNLFLKVLNKRPDGFHNISTVFERIDLSDEILLKLNPSGDIRIDCVHPQVPGGPKNLVYQAAKLLRDDFRIKEGVDIYIKKNIPVAAGLGGGSGNAATVLKGLNELWKFRLSRPQLLSYARRLGSDVAFFLYDCPWALGTERGDFIQRLDIKTKLWHVLVVPCVKIYSGEVYGGLGLAPAPEAPRKMLTKRNDNASIFIHHLRRSDVAQIGRGLVNDLERVVLLLSPQLEKLEQRLKLLDTKGVMVSGSGPCVFAVVETQQQAKDIQRILSGRYSRVFVAKTL
ncbi:MAG: 4-(cytidine 5'-diphospho)-2-C-methyl-D-erythritol kinase [Candidatus Omnitrophica bacterium]|nr:4-(cytidine 5'-diphospho)-2-C-methyl-D-erythritol kinase [Candidatus Omnitrophota bacterium]